ncbi:kinesin-like protein KIF26B [Lampris incognitus]|uniref:kinesin-like protein KIF26B n=1 Tax=Lampris incognitus TaxID=2546036 RepID=UPI0024B499DD|nr:kinesin-like protein KIF26B [Lampris incognitus]
MASLTRKGERCPATGKGKYWSLRRQFTRSDEDLLNHIGPEPGVYGPTMWEDCGVRRSERQLPCCDKCSATLVALKKQALSLAVHHHLSSKDSTAVSAFLHDNLGVHSSRSTVECRETERDQGLCGACGTHLNQLKQEAIQLALTREQGRRTGQSYTKTPLDSSLITATPTRTVPRESETKGGDNAPREGTVISAALGSPQLQSRTHSPNSPRTPRSPRTPQRTPQSTRRRGPKLPNPDMDRWVEEQQQLAASAAKSVSMSGSNSVAIYPYHQTPEEVIEACGDAGNPQSSPKIAHISRMATMANSVAMSFLARAAQKLNLTSRKKGVGSDPAPAHLTTCFREIIQKSPPPVPPCLLQAATKTKGPPSIGKVKVMLRVRPTTSTGPSQPPILRIDPSKRRVIVMEPVCSGRQHAVHTEGGEAKALPKSYTFDAIYPQESNQAEVCTGVLADVIGYVVGGSDGCVLGLRCTHMGSWSAMVGTDESAKKMGLIPCAVSWLYSAIERRREKTWTDLTVSVSAIELCCGEEQTLRDLLAEVAPSSGNIQDSPAAHISLREDPVYGIQLRNHNRVKAPTAERAASLLDAAIASRYRGSKTGGGVGGDIVTPLYHSSIMFFTLHVQPPRTENSTSGKVPRGPNKLTLIDICSSVKGLTGVCRSKREPPHSELGPTILSLLSGYKNIPNKSSKLTMLLRDSLGHVNCHTAVIAQVADSQANLLEALSTIQLAARIRRTQKRTKQSASCSPRGRSLSKERRGPPPLSLRAFRSMDEVDVDIPHLRLYDELDERSSSDQSCDTVIHIDSDGSVQPRAFLTLAQPEFVPIIPSLHPIKHDTDDPEFAALLQELLSIPRPQGEKKKEETVGGKVDTLQVETGQPERDCLKCDTFAELQERLGCIDGSETGINVPKLSLSPDLSATTNSRPQKDMVKPSDTDSSGAPQILLLNQELRRSQISAGEKPADGELPEESFQREDSGLYDCEEGSAASSSEEPQNHTLNRNAMRQADSSELSNCKTPTSLDNLSSQNCVADPLSTTVPNSLPLTLKPTESHGRSETSDWLKPEMRISPVGKSSPVSPSLFSPTSSYSSSPSLATSVILGDILSHLPPEEVKEMKATITVTVQQPLDLTGQDELVFSMVEEVTIRGALDKGRRGGNIIHIRDTCQSPAQDQDSGRSRPVRIISNISEDSGAAGCPDMTVSPVVQAVTKGGSTQNLPSQFRKEKKLLPSFINPMLIDTDSDCCMHGAKQVEGSDDSFTGAESMSWARQSKLKCSEHKGTLGKKSQASTTEIANDKKSESLSVSPQSQISYNTPVRNVSQHKHTVFYDDTAEKKSGGRRHRNTDRSHPRRVEHVCPTNTPRGLMGEETSCRIVGNAPGSVSVLPGYPATVYDAPKTASLPSGWHSTKHQKNSWDDHTVDNHKGPRGVTSSNPCSPEITLERRQGRQHSTPSYSVPFSPPRKYSTENRYDTSSLKRKGIGSLSEGLSAGMKHDSLSGSFKSPIEESSSRLFSAKLEQLAGRTNSLGRAPVECQTLERGSSTTSVSSKGSSRGSSKGSFDGNYKEGYEGGSTLPRASRSPRRTPRCVPMTDPSYSTTSSINASQSPRSTRTKLSAVGKLKMVSPKVRRLSAPTTKNLSFSPSGLCHAISRSTSLSPVGKSLSPGQMSSSSSSCPPWSSHSTSQSSICSSTKAPIQGIINGRISDLLKDRETSPTSGGMYKTTTRCPTTEDRLSGYSSSTDRPVLPSPYSCVTAPRIPSHLSGNASDVTSVLSGELPPAMGKTSLLWTNRNSVVSSGYESMLRDSEATGSSTSNRDSVSDKSSSLLSIARSSRTSRRRGNTGPHQHRLSHDGPPSMRNSASGLRSRWVDRGIPEAYEIKVYEIDDVERMQKRAGAGKQGPACFSAKLKFLEHRQQRISEVRAKYNNLMREMEQAKQNLMLERTKWNQEYDLWQTFEVDPLEHLEALEVVTARLESRVNLCKANVMMVTCFDGSTRRRQKRRRRTAPQHHGFMGI